MSCARTLGAGAINALKCKGACLEKDWPFDLEAVNNGPPEDLYQQAMDYKISNGINIPVDLETMQKCLADVRPSNLPVQHVGSNGEHVQRRAARC